MKNKKIKIVSIGIVLLVIIFGFYFKFKTVKEGERYTRMLPLFNMCAFGLKSISADVYSAGFGCGRPMCPCYICTKCGDDICGKGENPCNCPDDCSDGESGDNEVRENFKPEFHKSDDFNGSLN